MKYTAFIMAFTLLFTLPLRAAANEEATYTYWDVHPLHVGGTVIAMGKADISNTSYNGKLRFNKTNASVSLIAPINEKNFFIPRIEWNTFEMNWDKNPKFSTTRFYFMQFGLTFYTNAIEQWRWIARLDCNMDIQHFGNNRYNLFSALFWGAYEIWNDWHYHVGVYGYTGMRGAEVYPIIGLDYAPNKHWLFYFVFPLDYKIQYQFDKQWSLAIKGRPLKERFRTGNNEPQPRSVFSYSSIGTELNARYEKFLRLEIEAYIGWNFGGSFYIKKQNGRAPLYTDLGGSPYVGGSINYGF